MAEQEPPPARASLQLDHAEFEQPAAAAVTCSQCQQVVADQYYEAGGRTLCERCRRQIEADLNSGTPLGRFVRAAVLGSLAGVVGSILWYALKELSDGGVWGFMALAVGYLVGAAVRVGARGRGGWTYQLLALALTYFSIAVTFAPEIYREWPRIDETGAEVPGVARVVLAFVVSLGAPVLVGFQSILAGLIIGFGLYQAWQMNKRVELRFNGPFRVGSAPPPAPAAIA